jgi:hypothetical protein
LLMQLTDDGRQVDKLRLHRLHFRFDLVRLPRETLRAAVRANLTDLVSRRLGSFCSAARSMASISDAVSFGLSPTSLSSGFRLSRVVTRVVSRARGGWLSPLSPRRVVRWRGEGARGRGGPPESRQAKRAGLTKGEPYHE